MNDLELEMAKWTDILQNKRASNAQLEGRVAALKPQKIRMESQAAESLRASKNKDPQFEELCKWWDLTWQL
jgi:hypothetical protein